MKNQALVFKSFISVIAAVFGIQGCAHTARADFANAPAFGACPDLAKRETMEDCPWADASRAIENLHDANAIRSVLAEKIPGFLPEIEADAKARDILNLWGLSRNIDESNLSTGLKTVPPSFLEFLAHEWKVPFNPSFTEGHAGATHTYGYLMSTMSTPYGYKRARYVRGETEQGFGLPDRTLSGIPTRGTLLMNLTQFAGRIAFRDNEASELELTHALENPAVTKVLSLYRYDYASLKPKRLVEIVDNEKFYLELRTDIVNFPHPNRRGTNTALLIYSIDFREKNSFDDGAALAHPKLITAFPVDANFAKGLFNPAQLGEKVHVNLKYNAVLPVSVPANELVGRRFILNESN
jgi:hypothetical protein